MKQHIFQTFKVLHCFVKLWSGVARQSFTREYLLRLMSLCHQQQGLFCFLSVFIW